MTELGRVMQTSRIDLKTLFKKGVRNMVGRLPDLVAAAVAKNVYNTEATSRATG